MGGPFGAGARCTHNTNGARRGRSGSRGRPMMKQVLVAAVMTVAGLAATTGTASAQSTVKISKTMMKYSGIKYFRNKAENIKLGAFGQKKNGGRYLAVEDEISRGALSRDIKVSGPYNVDWKKTSKGEAKLSVKYMKVAGGTASMSWERAHSANLKLVKFYIHEGPLKTIINKNPNGVLDAMKNERKQARVVSEVWVAMEARLASDISTCGGGSIQANVKGFDINLGANGCGGSNSTITIPTNTTFAYLLHKVKKWNKSKRKKTTIADMEDDQFGMR